MWISEPTPVISRAKEIDSGSISRPISTWNDPAGRKSYSITWRRRSASSKPRSSTKASTATAKEASDIAVPRRWPQRSVRRPNSSRIAAPTAGSAIMSQEAPITPPVSVMISAGCTEHLLVLQQVRVVDRCGPAGTEHRHDDREADHDLGRRHDHDEERDDLSVQVPVLP